MSDLFLTRARLRTDLGVQALRPLLVPEQGGAAAMASHRLVWSLCADGPDRRRDFLWRETAPGTFLILSGRPPGNPHGLFALDPPKPFDPGLRPGRRLRFDLRVNATVSPSRGSDQRGQRIGLLAQRLRKVEPQQRAAVARDVALDWLTRQGERHGFMPDSSRFALRAQDRMALPRGRSGLAMIEWMELVGELEVSDPEKMRAALALGFGRARAFGFGLMLLARA
jgi:CRISPR system Cascade subunit CasE